MSWSKRALDWVERAGNKLPDPLILFSSVSLIVLVMSSILSGLGVSAQHPATGESVKVVNLLSNSGVQRILTEMVKNFAHFPPLGLVLVVMIGIGVAERSGLITASLKKLVSAVPKTLLPATMVFAGVNASLAADAGYVVLVPLGAVVFAAFGRHPLAGMAATFAGVSGGFSANLFLTSLDPLLAGISTKAAQTVEAQYVVQASANYYFMLASVFMLTLVGAWVTTHVIEPRLGVWKNSGAQAAGLAEDALPKLSAQEQSGLRAAFYTLVIIALGVVLLVVPEGAALRDPQHGIKPFYESIVALLMLLFLACGIAYGRRAGTIRRTKDLSEMTSETMASMGSYIVLAFVAAQFIAYFQWSNIGLILAITGAEGLKSIGLTGTPLLVLFVFLAAFINLFIGSASAKWALMAPVFVPMLMLVGIAPETTQLAYRIGDSVTNIICPLLPYLPLIITFAKKYVPDSGLGTVFSLMIPYSFSFLISWIILFVAWMGLGLPLGF